MSVRHVLLLALASFGTPGLAQPAYPDTAEAAIAEAKRLGEAGAKLDALMLLQEAASHFPDDGVLRHELAIAYHSLDRFREALEAYGKASELAPEDPDFRLAYGGALYQSGDVEAGRDQLLQVVAHPDGPSNGYVVLAAVYEKLGEPESAYEALERYLALEPADEATRFLYAEQLVAAKQSDKALSVLKAGLAVDTGDESDDGGSAELYHRIAEAASRGSDHEGDLERYALLAIEKDPVFLAPRLLLGRRLGAENAGRAIALLEPALEDHAEVPELHFVLSTAYRRLGMTEKAEASASAFQRFSKARSDAEDQVSRVAATYKRASELLQRGQMLEAEKVFHQVLEIDTEHAQTRAMLAKIAYSKQDLSEARRWLDEALERDSTIGEYHYLSALFFFKAGDLSSAVGPARRAVELDPGFPDNWSLLGSLLTKLEPEEAADCFLRAAALEPSDPVPFLNLAGLYASTGNSEKEQWAMGRYEAVLAGKR